jgi:hypothetical protein
MRPGQLTDQDCSECARNSDKVGPAALYEAGRPFQKQRHDLSETPGGASLVRQSGMPARASRAQSGAGWRLFGCPLRKYCSRFSPGSLAGLLVFCLCGTVPLATLDPGITHPFVHISRG